ncbi:ATP-dependent RNA helicase DBP5, putative [Plasmodium gallinaceum]|uniref:RNA helicase n=1 Tax=Plasmodium gallinaceum TaxID=5849 RepID=A0A1J1GR65_PLAGA|nr:ATP-dependent RNA helicase DBP5, putative [Plasmodium gallinaceum]CRG94786.1 ATP-dependent RNA helicase DBP5, putative [Plasmodium gallinaceum]
MDTKESINNEKKDEQNVSKNKTFNTEDEQYKNDENIKSENAKNINSKDENLKNEETEDGNLKNNENKDNKDENVMNMFLSYIQKNKDDPQILQQMLNIMNNQMKNSLSANPVSLNSTNINEKEKNEGLIMSNTENLIDKNQNNNQSSKDKEKDDDKKINEENENLKLNGINTNNNKNQLHEKKNIYEFNKLDNLNELDEINKVNDMHNSGCVEKEMLPNLINNNVDKKNISESHKGNNSNLNNFGLNNLNSNKLDNNNADEHMNKNIYINQQNFNDKNILNTEDKGLIKKKHNELVEDNDEYVIENNETKESFEEEAVSLIEKLKILNNEKNKTDTPNNLHIKTNNNNNQSDFKLYHSKNTWEELKIDNELIQILTYLKFFSPSKIQAYALPIILNSNKNLIAQSQNGSGKTLTFVIAILSKINRNLSSLQSMCICPTRELSQQNYDVISSFTKYLNVKVFLAVPLCEKYNKSGGFQIYVGTPGKTLDFLKRKYIDTNNIKLFVLDEADDLIDIKNNMSTQVESIKRFLPRNCQILLFSATYNKDVRLFADQFAPQSTKISVRQEDLTLKCVKQYYLITENDEQKYYYLSELYCSMTISQCVIFVNSKKSAYNLYKFMTDNNHNVTLICADSVISRFTKNQVQKANVLVMDPQTRDTLMSDFKKGISKVLICTDLLSRGIDVPSISLVINFDLPYIYQGRIEDNSNSFQNQKVNMETYIHRIGRTGRFGSKGMAINFISKNQLPHINQIEQFYKCVISDLEFDSELMKTSLTKLKN